LKRFKRGNDDGGVIVSKAHHLGLDLSGRHLAWADSLLPVRSDAL
jgi:hypothetical protein